MRLEPQGPVFELSDLADPRSAAEALAHWDELDPALLAALEADPHHAPRLALLRAAERWMRAHSAPETASEQAPERATAVASTPACPSAEELYQAGGGPGSTSLSSAQRATIDAHAAGCAQCAALLATLVARDGSALGLPAEVARLIEPRPGRTHVEPAVRVHPARHSQTRRWIPLAAAASLIATAAVWFANGTSEHPLTFPGAPLLRGEAHSALLYPRDRVLLPSTELRASWPELQLQLRFEINPQDEATSYRVALFRHAGGAFAAREPLATLTAAEPSIAFVPSAAAPTLAAGHYTWEAWALVRGLDLRLGARDFELREDAALSAQLSRLAARAEPERTLAAVNLLHAQGYASDARALARQLPQSAERDAYLGQVPGR